jgi:hypothetical protein
MAMTTFLFLLVTHDLLGLPRKAVRSGEPRLRPFVPTPVPVPPACAGFPDRDIEPTAATDESGDRRARVSGPSEGRVLVREGAF